LRNLEARNGLFVLPDVEGSFAKRRAVRSLEVSLLVWEGASWQSDVSHKLLQAEDEAKAARY